MYKCYYHVSSSSAADWLSKLFIYIEAMGWVKEKGLEVADGANWQNTHAYAQGDVVKPTTPNGKVYICSTAGTSAASEPTWGTTIKGETTSGTAKFRCYPVGCIYSSQAESGTEPKTYLYFYTVGDLAYAFFIGAVGIAQWVSATWLITGYTHGNSPSTPYELLTGVSANPAYSWVYGDKNCVLIQVLSGATYYYCLFGHYSPVFTQRTVLTSAATAGSSVNLAVASSADVYAGQWLQMWGAAEEGRDKLVVSAVPDSTHITVTTLPRNYSSGSWIGVNPAHALLLPRATGAPNSACMASYMTLDAVGTGYAVAAGNSLEIWVYAQLTIETAPDYRLQKYLLRPCYLYSGESSGATYHICGYLPNNILLSGKTVSSLDLFLVYDGYVYPVSGTATSGGATTLTDTSKTLTTDAWIDYILVITAGTGIGQTRKIVSNTATEFTVNTWNTNPDATSVYAVVEEAWRALTTGVANSPVVKEIL